MKIICQPNDRRYLEFYLSRSKHVWKPKFGLSGPLIWLFLSAFCLLAFCLMWPKMILTRKASSDNYFSNCIDSHIKYCIELLQNLTPFHGLQFKSCGPRSGVLFVESFVKRYLMLFLVFSKHFCNFFFQFQTICIFF